LGFRRRLPDDGRAIVALLPGGAALPHPIDLSISLAPEKKGAAD
jgi:hypothetical protein